MPTSPKDALVDSMRDLAWSLWTELGVSGTVRNHQDVLVDLEALILFTAALGDLDPRLRDESLDWCIQFGHFASVSRLKNLLAEGLGSEETFSIYASRVNAASTWRWPTKKTNRGRGEDAEEETNHKSREPELTKRPALLALRMRALFGVGARADILTELLYESSQLASELAAIGYSKRQVAKILDDLESAGVVASIEAGKIRRRYELADPLALVPLVGMPARYGARWVECFTVLLALHQLIETQETKSDRLKPVAAMEVVFTTHVDAIEKLRWGMPVTASADTLWQRVMDWSAECARRAADGPPDPRNVSYLAALRAASDRELERNA